MRHRVPAAAEPLEPRRHLAGDFSDAELISRSPTSINHGPQWFAAMDGFALFTGYDAAHAHELWRTDGTPEGTRLLMEFRAGTAEGWPFGIVRVGDVAYFFAEGQAGPSLWKSDGTVAGTTRVRSFQHPADSQIGTLGGRVIVAASTGQSGQELWLSDGTAAGTVMVDVNPGPRGSTPHHFVTIGDRTYFQADDGVHGFELWATDGTPAGTHMMFQTPNGPNGSGTDMPVAVGDKLYVKAYSGGLLEFDRDGGNLRVATTETVHPVAAPGGRLIVQSYARNLLYTLDPATGALTSLGAVARVLNRAADRYGRMDVRDYVYFTRPNAVGGEAIWRTDGTPAGTVYLANDTGTRDSFIQLPTAVYVRDKFVVAVQDHTGELALWSSDGTPEGTSVIDRFGGDFYGVFATVALGGTLLFGTHATGRSDVYKMTLNPFVDVRGTTSLDEGGQATLTVDAYPGVSATLDHVEVDWGDGTAPQVVVPTSDRPVTVTHRYADGPLTAPVRVRAFTSAGVVEADPFAVEVRNVAPTLGVSVPASAVQREPVTVLPAVLADPGDDAIDGWRIDWGDGTETVVDGPFRPVSHTYARPGVHAATLYARDEDAPAGTMPYAHAFTVDVADVAPRVKFQVPQGLEQGRPFPVRVFTIVKEPADDVALWTIDWGDGSTSQVANPGSTRHTYASGGSYLITVSGTQADGGPVSRSYEVAVAGARPKGRAEAKASAAARPAPLPIAAAINADPALLAGRFSTVKVTPAAGSLVAPNADPLGLGRDVLAGDLASTPGKRKG